MLYLRRHRTISSTTLRADWSISSWTNERQRRARACCWGSSRTISSPYRYTPMALKTNQSRCNTHESIFFFSRPPSGTRHFLVYSDVRIYLVVEQEVFHVSVRPRVGVFDRQLTPAMSHLSTEGAERERPLRFKITEAAQCV